MIEPPKSSKLKSGIRVVVEALAQATPVTASLAHLFRFSNPSEMERAVASWRDQVSDALNTHDASLRRLEEKIEPRLRVSENALELMLWLAETSEDGMSTPLNFDALLSAFPETGKETLEEACHELQHLNFASLSATFGHPVRLIRPTYDLFWVFDPISIGTNPTADAAAIAQLMIDDNNMASIPVLHEKLGWPKRRLNPAVARLMPFVSDKRTRTVIQNDYPTMGFVLAAEDRFKLKRFIENVTATKPHLGAVD
ncbi:MAG: hypothetical protein OXL41_09435 [Nitrospinae bacterium]|nr:hypothetical protein [Nitrospinota bacterium]